MCRTPRTGRRFGGVPEWAPSNAGYRAVLELTEVDGGLACQRARRRCDRHRRSRDHRRGLRWHHLAIRPLAADIRIEALAPGGAPPVTGTWPASWAISDPGRCHAHPESPSATLSRWTAASTCGWANAPAPTSGHSHPHPGAPNSGTSVRCEVKAELAAQRRLNPSALPAQCRSNASARPGGPRGQHQGDHDRVVGIADHREEVRDKIYRHDQVAE